jgi:hypothetical protein
MKSYTQNMMEAKWDTNSSSQAKERMPQMVAITMQKAATFLPTDVYAFNALETMSNSLKPLSLANINT